MMDGSVVMSPIPQEIYIPQKLKAFMSEPQGSALVAALEGQFNCSINVVNDVLSVGSIIAGAQTDITYIETILRDAWQKREVQRMIREAALNVSCTHVCQTLLPRAYCAVVSFFSPDIQRRSRCNDIIIDHFSAKVTMYGNEYTVNKARELMIECLTEYFGLLEIDIPEAQRTTRMGYGMSANTFNTQAPPPTVSSAPFLNNVFSMGEPNAILTSTPPATQKYDEPLMSSNFDNHLLFQSDFPQSPQQLPAVHEAPISPPRTNNVEKVKQWIPTAEVGKILGNRAAMKKQIEGQFNCVITVHTEIYSPFGMTSVEIMAQNKDQCQGARDAVLLLMQSHEDKLTSAAAFTDSGINSPSSPSTQSPSTTPEKRGGSRPFHRSSFRDQPKVMLALTPRKVQSPNE